MSTAPIVLPLARAADALRVVTDPAAHHDRPGLRLIAWATLMRRRGRTMCQRRVREDQRARGMI